MHQSLLLVWVLLSISKALIGTRCKCSEILEQNDCQSLKGCGFVSQDQFKGCVRKNFQPNCSYYSTNQLDCDNVSGCAWNNNLICSKFSQCSDYILKPGQNANLCNQKDSTCVPGSLEQDGSRNCTTGIADCTTFTDQTICNNIQLGMSSKCYWSSYLSYCIPQDYSKCSTIKDSVFCMQQNCVYKNSICDYQSCADIKDPQKCTSIRANENERFQICVWRDHQCWDADDTSHLTNSNCFINTNKTYQWNNQTLKCEPCMTRNNDDDQTKLIIGLSVSIPTFLLIVIIVGTIFYVKWKKQKEQKEKKNPYEITRSIRLFKDVRMEENIKERNCRFCHGEFQGEEEVLVTECKHMFHNKCLEDWKKANQQCPICNSIINQV